MPRPQASQSVAADIWFHDPTAPPVPTIPAEFMNMKKASKKKSRSSVHATESSVSSNASDTSSTSSSGPYSPSTAKTTPRSSLENLPIPSKPFAPHRKQVLVRMLSSESMRSKTAASNDFETPVVSYQPRRKSSYADLPTPRQAEPVTRQTALRSHALTGLSGPISAVEVPVVKTKTRRFTIWGSRRPTLSST
jgi:hypothetical protein